MFHRPDFLRFRKIAEQLPQSNSSSATVTSEPIVLHALEDAGDCISPPSMPPRQRSDPRLRTPYELHAYHVKNKLTSAFFEHFSFFSLFVMIYSVQVR